MIDTRQSLLEERNALQAKLADVESKIREAQQGERKKAVEAIRDLMAKFGISAADLSDGTRAPKRQQAGDVAERAKVAPKFRNGTSGETWSGRGLQPKWLKAAIAEGKSLDDFRI